ncbi:hypothetical protein MIND_01145400 [Mycena indigotica]|uniref:Uncharacterized protein n=1 Tax=Mycena indigotica TaxID=2126181 RepID=A0A8H6S7K9_9AGAR|nr:uncharacterized protein MIND_01145400 [Mycena indigotica]KAF7293655.1 hypothetical protein MIND_01145400 [Mycena indigotica]
MCTSDWRRCQWAAQASTVPLVFPPPVEVQMQIEETPPEPTKLRKSGLPDRRRRVPAKFDDAAPALPPRVRRQPAAASTDTPEAQLLLLPPAPPRQWVRTQPSLFGLYKVYPRRPTHDPDDDVTLDDLYLLPRTATKSTPTNCPFPKNHEENPGSISGFDRLVHNILQPDDEAHSDGVNLADLPRPKFSTKKFLDDLDKNGFEPLGVMDKKLQEEIDAPEFTVTDIHYLDPIREVLQGPLFAKLHTTPFSLRFDPLYDSRSPDDVSLDDDSSPELPWAT